MVVEYIHLEEDDDEEQAQEHETMGNHEGETDPLLRDVEYDDISNVPPPGFLGDADARAADPAPEGSTVFDVSDPDDVDDGDIPPDLPPHYDDIADEEESSTWQDILLNAARWVRDKIVLERALPAFADGLASIPDRLENRPRSYQELLDQIEEKIGKPVRNALMPGAKTIDKILTNVSEAPGKLSKAHEGLLDQTENKVGKPIRDTLMPAAKKIDKVLAAADPTKKKVKITAGVVAAGPLVAPLLSPYALLLSGILDPFTPPELKLPAVVAPMAIGGPFLLVNHPIGALTLGYLIRDLYKKNPAKMTVYLTGNPNALARLVNKHTDKMSDARKKYRDQLRRQLKTVELEEGHADALLKADDSEAFDQFIKDTKRSAENLMKMRVDERWFSINRIPFLGDKAAYLTLAAKEEALKAWKDDRDAKIDELYEKQKEQLDAIEKECEEGKATFKKGTSQKEFFKQRRNELAEENKTLKTEVDKIQSGIGEGLNRYKKQLQSSDVRYSKNGGKRSASYDVEVNAATEPNVYTIYRRWWTSGSADLSKKHKSTGFVVKFAQDETTGKPKLQVVRPHGRLLVKDYRKKDLRLLCGLACANGMRELSLSGLTESDRLRWYKIAMKEPYNLEIKLSSTADSLTNIPDDMNEKFIKLQQKQRKRTEAYQAAHSGRKPGDDSQAAGSMTDEPKETEEITGIPVLEASDQHPSVKISQTS